MTGAYAVIQEAERAQARFGDFTSTHEALGVLAEEVAELTEAVRSNVAANVEREAKQVAAVALRLLEHCLRKAPDFYARSCLT